MRRQGPTAAAPGSAWNGAIGGQVDTQQHGELLQQLGIDPQHLDNGGYQQHLDPQGQGGGYGRGGHDQGRQGGYDQSQGY